MKKEQKEFENPYQFSLHLQQNLFGYARCSLEKCSNILYNVVVTKIDGEKLIVVENVTFDIGSLIVSSMIRGHEDCIDYMEELNSLEKWSL